MRTKPRTDRSFPIRRGLLMPPWFYTLLLVVALTGFVFLFVQGRLIRDSLARLVASLSALDRRLASLEARAEKAPPFHVELPEEVRVLPQRVGHGLEAVQACLEGLNERLSGCEGEMAAVRLLSERAEERAREASMAPPPPAPEPEDVARRFLLEEGFSSLILTPADEPMADGSTRIYVRARFGDQSRTGHVTVRGDRVVDAAVEVPSGLFP